MVENKIPQQRSVEDASRFENTFDEHDLFTGSYSVPPMSSRLDERYGDGGWFTRSRSPRTMAEKLMQNMGFEIHDVYVTPEGDTYAQLHPPNDAEGTS